MSAIAAETAAAEKAGIPPPSDTAMKGVVQLVQRLRKEINESGEVDVPRYLGELRSEATALGFPSDAAGLSAFLQHEADAAANLDRDRREAGFGGLLRRTVEATPVLRGKAALADVAATRPFRDPAFDVGFDALLTQRVHAATSRMDAMMKGGR